MARHFRRSRSGRRLIRFIIPALALVLVAGGIWSVAAATGEGPGTAVGTTAGPTAGPAEAAVTTAAAGTGGRTQAPRSSMPSSTPSGSTAATNPATGRVDTLDGLVPDYVLPPIENGMVPVLTKIPTEQKVVFLTLDDGAVKRDADLALLEKSGIKASLFLANTFIAGDPQFFEQFTAAGHLVENHSMSHDLGFIQMDYEAQKAEICGMADYAEAHYGRRPVFFRPPGGPYTQATRQAAAECGMKAIVDWEAKANAKGMDYQVGAGLRPGDIVLMHFRPEFAEDLAAFTAARKAAGLKVVLLEDYLATR